MTIYSVGHGGLSFAYFLELLKQFEIEFVCDVRSVARSRTAHNGKDKAREVPEMGIYFEVWINGI